MSRAHSGWPAIELANPIETQSLQNLVNRLAQELAEVRRTLAVSTRKSGTASHTLELRTRELGEARAALAVLLATLDSTTDGILALGQFGRAMHYNIRFVEMWRISADKLPTLNESALLAMQLSQVRDPAAFLAQFEARKAEPDLEQASRVEMADGRMFDYRAMPQRVTGKRLGCVMRFNDITPQRH